MLLSDQGKYEEAKPLYERVLAGQESNKALGPEYPSTLSTVGNLAILFWTLGELNQAKVFHDRELKLAIVF